MATSEQLTALKGILRESEVPFFDDAELEQQLSLANGDVETAAYNCLIIKSEDCSLSVSGLSLPDSSEYWLRLAAMYRPCRTKIVG